MRKDLKEAIKGSESVFNEKCFALKQSANLVDIATSLFEKAIKETNKDKKIELFKEAIKTEEQAILADSDDVKGVKRMRDFIQRVQNRINEIQNLRDEKHD